MFYDFAGPHDPLQAAGRRKRITPAMAAGVADHIWSVWEIAALLDRAVQMRLDRLARGGLVSEARALLCPGLDARSRR